MWMFIFGLLFVAAVIAGDGSDDDADDDDVLWGHAHASPSRHNIRSVRMML